MGASGTDLNGDVMPNGASVSDWLGTAALAARGASISCEAARSQDWVTETLLRKAADDAAQALQEICAVMDHYGYAHGYDAACTFGDAS